MKTMQRNNMNPALISMLKRTDIIHAEARIVPERDYITFDHLTQERENFGDIVRILKDSGDIRYESAAEFRLRELSTGLINDARIHFITDIAQSDKVTIIELDSMVKCYNDAEHEVIYAKSFIRPIKQARFDKLLSTGEVTDNGTNVIVEAVTTNFSYTY